LVRAGRAKKRREDLGEWRHSDGYKRDAEKTTRVYISEFDVEFKNAKYQIEYNHEGGLL